MEPLTISGAYGRDYASVGAILLDWAADKDFIIRNWPPTGGLYLNRQDADRDPTIQTIMVRYQRDRKICAIRKTAKGWRKA